MQLTRDEVFSPQFEVTPEMEKEADDIAAQMKKRSEEEGRIPSCKGRKVEVYWARQL